MHIINLFRNKNRENIFELGDKKLERLKKENRVMWTFRRMI